LEATYQIWRSEKGHTIQEQRKLFLNAMVQRVFDQGLVDRMTGHWMSAHNHNKATHCLAGLVEPLALGELGNEMVPC
jgi:hypothetical protein